MKKMNKTFKRIAIITSASLLAACAMVPATMNAFAATGEKSITITDTNGFTHTDVKAYQIFSGNVTDKGLNITGWGDGINVAKFVEALKADNTLQNDFASIIFGTVEGTENLIDNAIAATVDDKKIAVAVANIISGYDSESEKAELIAKLAIANKATASGTYAANVISDIATGYYVVADETGATHANPTATEYSLGMLKVVDNTANLSVTTKMGYPEFTKEINDINDSTDTAYEIDSTTGKYTSGGTWGTDADHDIGDNVPFKLKATVPANIADYDQYKMVFHDNLQADVFDLNENSIVVKYYQSNADTEPDDVTAAFEKDFTGGVNDNFAGTVQDEKAEDFSLTCNDITNITGVTVASGGYFVVEYTAALTDDAKIGDDGNWNSAYLEYSNNPNFIGGGTNMPTANTPEETVVAFTYQTVINKIDGITEQPLDGAGFTLYKLAPDGTTWNIVKKYENVTQSTFDFVGLDDGTYKLSETQVPANYNGIADVEFEITGTHSGKALTALNGITADKTGEDTVIQLGTSTQKGSVDLANGKISATIANLSGTTLPGTGGIGTTIFYLGGGVMATIGGVYLISKRRMKKSEE